MKTRNATRWLLLSSATLWITLALVVWSRDAPSDDPARDSLRRAITIADRAERYADLALYWPAFDLASVEALRDAEAAPPEKIEALLDAIPRPRNISLDVVYFAKDPETRRVDFGRYHQQHALSRPLVLLLIASRGPRGRDEGAHLAFLTRGLGRWELTGSMTVPDPWNLGTVWWSATQQRLAVAWRYVRGTQVSEVLVRVMYLGGSHDSATLEFIDGAIEPTAAGLLVEHRLPSMQEGDGTRKNPHFIPTESLDWDGDLSDDPPMMYSLIELENPKQVFPRPDIN